MSKKTKELLSEILNDLDSIDYIQTKDFPNIDLYMDQVTTFINERLGATKRYDDDKVLTKTMINNYAKNQLLPAPEKKKYSKDHLLTLVFIYYFKNILSINDIQRILDPVLEKYFKSHKTLDLADIYNEVFRLESSQIQVIHQDIWDKFHLSQTAFLNAPEKEQQFLQQFALICELSFDVYYKKLLLERMIDALDIPPSNKKSEKKAAKSAPDTKGGSAEGKPKKKDKEV